MADSYHIIDGQVVPFHGGRKDTNTGAWRDATPLELQLQEQLAAAEEALAEAAAVLEAAREDAARMDWLEGETHPGIRLHSGNFHSDEHIGLGTASTGRTLRQAIDAARGADNG